MSWFDAVWFKEATNLFRCAGALKWNLFSSLSKKASTAFFYEVSLFTFKYPPYAPNTMKLWSKSAFSVAGESRISDSVYR